MALSDRGSNWGKWDLHIHSPDTHLANGYNGDWPGFVNALADVRFNLIGVTNYFLFADDEVERTQSALRESGLTTVVVGNLEFRLTQPNKDGEAINAHVLFDPRISSKEINHRLSRLKLINTSDPGGVRQIYCNRAEIDVAKQELKNITVEFRALRDWIHENFDPDDCLLIGCPTGYGSFRPQRNEGRGASLAVEFDKACSLMFGGQGDREFFANPSRYVGAVAKPVLLGSDAHSVNEIGRAYSWVKAKPTFDGLRQLVYEPLERISLARNNPELEYPKPYFSALHIGGPLSDDQPLNFHHASIALNRDFVAVIGGRGSGKSILLDSILALTQPSRVTTTVSMCYRPPVFTIEFTKQHGAESIALTHDEPIGPDYLHVRQTELQAISLNPTRLSQEIKALLPIKAVDPLIDVEEEMSSLLREKEEIFEWLLEQDEQGNQINNPQYNEEVKRVNAARVATLTNEKNKLLVSEYNGNRKTASEAVILKNKLTAFATRVNTVAKELADEIKGFNVLLLPRGQQIPAVDLQPQIAAINHSTDELNSYSKQLDERSAEVLQTLREQGVEQDPKGLLDKVEGYQREVAHANDRIERYKEKKARAHTLNELRTALVDTHLQDIRAEAIAIGVAFESLKQGQEGWKSDQVALVNELLEGVEISGCVHFDKDAFYDGMEPYLNMRKFRAAAGFTRREKLAARFGVDSVETFRSLLSGEAMIMSDDDGKCAIDRFVRESEFVGPGDALNFLEYLFKPSQQRKYLTVRAGLTYRGKPPERLSVGQRGTFFLCMKLATDPFGSPFVFDQPEDDLDNEFVVQKLVPIFRKIKKYRQVIIATHNANLVVNADADQVVIADNEAETLRYETGAIEEAHIRNKICAILEGGEAAFKQREWKYGLGAP
ncbi:TrlF family AAA-like ATPase [Burkholderia sp. Ax-1724]|uniref:TrlF family AAA-like ATPase n=1 Tax=Burkholderia sp. Ax-1724 TaxID=2608336 RepID=UPI001421A96A|nr:hypothetical protein [Burkholderia sp. Ax-1724]NIF53317.1 hypothetical protein [Burkholderia sp. Ax-1724]